MTKLDVYVAEACWTCQEARRLVAEVRPLVPDVQIELRDLADERRPSSVFAVPTYVLDGQIVFLGNPTADQLVEKLSVAHHESAA